MDLPKLRCEAEEPANLTRSAFDARVGLMRCPLRGRRRIAYLPVERHTVGGILGQQAMQERRASAWQAGDEERPADLLHRDVGVLLAISLNLEPVHQHVGEILTRRDTTDKIEMRFALH